MKPEEINKIKDLLIPLFIEKGVKKAVLFGACARNSETKKSDIDLMIVMDTNKRFFERYEQFEKIHMVFRDRAVDVLVYTPEELRSIAHRPFIRRIMREGKKIYEC